MEWKEIQFEIFKNLEVSRKSPSSYTQKVEYREKIVDYILIEYAITSKAC